MIKSYLTQVEEMHGAATDDLHRTIFRYLSRKYFPFPSDTRVLDIGTGLGHCAVSLHELGYHKMSVVDMDDRAFPRLSKIGINASMCDVSKEPLPHPDRSLDVIIAYHILEHLQNPDLLLKEAHRVLDNSGIVILATPDWNRSMKKFYDDETHVRPYSRKGLSRLMNRSGFEQINLTALDVFRWGLFYTRIWKLFPALCFTGRSMLYVGRKSEFQEPCI